MDEGRTEEPGSVAVASPLADTRSSLLTIIEAGTAGGGAGARVHDVYNDLKAAGKAVVSKISDRRPGPDEGEYVH